MQLFRGLEQWGRERILGVFAKNMRTPEISAHEAGAALRQIPEPRILLIGIYPKMGQFLCATPLIRSLRVANQRASLHFLGNAANAAAAQANPHLNRVWIWKKSAPWQWSGQLRSLRNEHFDLALLLSTERPSATSVFLARATGARWVAGYLSPDPGSEAKSVAALCHIHIPFGGEKNEVEKFLGIARAFDVAPQGLQPELVPTPADEAAAESFFSSHNFSAKGLRVGLFIGGKAERSDRLWPVAHFVQLANSLKEAGLQVIVLSPPPPAGASSHSFLPGEHLRLEEFLRSISWKCPVFQEASLGRVAAFLRRLDLLVSPDGGILHAAAAVRTPTLGLFFSTDPDVWRHDTQETVLDGRGKPSSEMYPEIVADKVFGLLGITVHP